MTNLHTGVSKSILSQKIQALKFAHNSDMIAFGSDENIVLLDHQTGQKRVFQKPNSSKTQCLTWSHDNKYIASAENNGFLYIWKLNSDMSSLQLLHSHYYRQDFPYKIDFGDNYQISVWKTQKFIEYQFLKNLEQQIPLNTVKIIPKNKTHVRKSMLKNLRSTDYLGSASKRIGMVFGDRFIACSMAPVLFLWDHKKNKEISLFHDENFMEETELGSLQLSHDERLLAWHLDKVSQVIDTHSAQTLTLHKLTGSLLFHPKGNVLFSSLHSGKKDYNSYAVKGLEFKRDQVLFSNHKGDLVCAQQKFKGADINFFDIFKFDGSELKRLMRIKPDTETVKQLRGSYNDATSTMCFGPGYSYIVFGTNEGYLEFWELKKLKSKMLLRQKISDTTIKQIRFDRSNHLYWITTEDAKLYIYRDLKTGNSQEIYPIEIFPQFKKLAVAISNNFQKIAFLNEDLEILVFKVD